MRVHDLRGGRAVWSLSLLALGLSCLGLRTSSNAQQFVNLNFESPPSETIAPDGIWLSWSLAAPGWKHPKGGDSVFVYHHTPPASSIAQFYFLADNVSTKWSPLEGNFSLALVSGHYNRADENSAWVKAYIEQDGIIPEGARTLHFLATGDFSVTLDSRPVTVTHIVANEYQADISEFSGQYASLRIANESSDIQSPVLVDAFQFSTQPIPEPGAGALMLCGLAVILLRKR